MPDTQEIVINTGPILAIVAAMGDLEVLKMYRQVWVPYAVCQEVEAGGVAQFALPEFKAAHWLKKEAQPLRIAPVLLNTLDQGEAAVIQLASDMSLSTVCIDEAVGRRIARLNGLSVTGSIGVLLRAWRQGYEFSMGEAIDRMQARGVWLSERVIRFALERAKQRES